MFFTKIKNHSLLMSDYKKGIEILFNKKRNNKINNACNYSAYGNGQYPGP